MAPFHYRDWTLLPADLLEEIATRNKACSDYVRFRAVCKSWRSSTPKTPTQLHGQLPWLLFPHPGNRCSILKVDSNKHRFLHLRETLRGPNRRYRGSSHGRVFISETLGDGHPRFSVPDPLIGPDPDLDTGPDPGLDVLPPFLRYSRFIQLSNDVNSLLNFALQSSVMIPHNTIRKIVLSDNPSRNPDNFTALAIFNPDTRNQNGELAFFRAGQTYCSLIQGTFDIADAIYFNGRVYAVESSGMIIVCDLSTNPPKVMDVKPIRRREHGITPYRLVSAGEELFLVNRFLEVYRLNSDERRWQWVRDLGDLALFVGDNCCSSALSASDFPGCRPNSIYFTFHGNPRRFGIFSLEGRGRFIQQQTLDYLGHPIWITPDPF